MRSSAPAISRDALAPHAAVRLLGDLAGMLQSLHDEESILRDSVDLLVTRLNLEAGGILVASHGVDASGAGGPGVPSHSCIPLKFDRGAPGILEIAAGNACAFSPDEIDLLETAGRLITLAVDRARTERAEARREKEAREALLRLQQAHYGMVQAERLSALGTLASCLAHEVRNPLNSISLQLVLLARRAARLEPPAREEQSALIESARREIARLDDLVEEFLSLSSIDRLRLEETDPADLVREVIALMLPMAQERNASLVESIERPLPLVRLDREKMKQVLINLVRNAVEAMPGGGQVTISCGSRGGRLLLAVDDTGTGIEPGLDVFDFFVTTKRGGTGLGLPIARRIVEAHGGTLTFISLPEKGTTFQVEMGAA